MTWHLCSSEMVTITCWLHQRSGRNQNYANLTCGHIRSMSDFSTFYPARGQRQFVTDELQCIFFFFFFFFFFHNLSNLITYLADSVTEIMQQLKMRIPSFFRVKPVLEEAFSNSSLTLTALWANSADKLIIFFLFFFQKIRFDISYKLGDNLHEMSSLIFWEKYFKLASAENFAKVPREMEKTDRRTSW